MKKLLSLILALILCIACISPAIAAQYERIYMFDNYGVFDEIELDELNERAVAIAERHGFDVGFVLSPNITAENTYVEAENFYNEMLARGLYGDLGLLFFFNADAGHISLYATPLAKLNFPEDAISEALDAYNDADTFYYGVMDFYDYIDRHIQPIPTGRLLPRLVDNANLLSSAEHAILLTQLDEISERRKFDVVIVTTRTLDGKSPKEFADDFFDYNDYGQGSDEDGILLLISITDERDWHIFTCGYGITAFTDAGLGYISDRFIGDLREDNFAGAFATFVAQCDEFLTQANTGAPYDVGTLPKAPFKPSLNVIISLVIGLVVALIVTAVLKGQLKSVRKQRGAAVYTREGSMALTRSHEYFLYSDISRTAIPQDSGSSGGGGSSTHTSSSGQTHGGAGGKF